MNGHLLHQSYPKHDLKTEKDTKIIKDDSYNNSDTRF